MIRILTDSSTGFSLEDVKKIGVEMAHLTINFDGIEYFDQKNITHDEFYIKFKTSKSLPKTSAVNQTAFEEFFEDVKKKGDEMIVLTIAKELSATHGEAVKAKAQVGYDKIHIIDTRAVATTLIALVMEAVRMRGEEKTAAEIIAELNKMVPKVKLHAYVDTLKYLRAGGRISGTSMVIGTLLKIKPALTLEDGKIISKHKTLGTKKAQEYLLSRLKENNVDFSKPVYFAHTNAKEECEKVKEWAKREHNLIDGGTWFISATVATHAGPGAVAIVFFVK